MPSPTSTNLFLEAGHALSRPYELICRDGWGHDPVLKMNFGTSHAGPIRPYK